MSPNNLSRVLWLDALSCAAIFALGAFASGPVGSMLGLPPAVVAIGGWICLAAGVLLAFLAVRPVRTLLALAIAGNIAWIAASLAVWFAWSNELTVLGHAVVLAQSVAVALFVILELRGLRRAPLQPGRA